MSVIARVMVTPIQDAKIAWHQLAKDSASLSLLEIPTA